MADARGRWVLRPQLWEHLPGDWEAVFGGTVPVAVEIGFGNGEYLAEMATRRSNWGFVGFDVALTCVERAARRLAQVGVHNVRLLQLDARFGLRELFADGAVQELYVHFPCPWPKARHADRRLFDASFVHTLGAVLVRGGHVHLVTDVLAYAQGARDALEESGLFRASAPERLLDREPETRYERKWRLDGRQIWGVRGTCTGTAQARRIAEGEMPHARVKGEVSWDALAKLVGLKESWSGGAYVLREVFASPGEQVALFRVFSTDDDFQQHYFLMVAKAHRGMVVKLDGATVPFRTPAVKRCVAGVAQVLQEGGA